jgi:small subunit ribosomal protein S29e/phospholipase B1
LCFFISAQIPIPTISYDCPSLPAPPPATSITQLHPGNIKAVMALGDSITAGFAMKGVPVEYRGLVFSIGGDEYISDFEKTKAITIPNILKLYNPNLQGQSTGETVPFTPGSNLDAAISEAKIADVPSQVQYLINTLKSAEYAGKIDFQNDWKLLTLFIGANNLCICCHNDSRGTPQYFEQNLRSILTLIQQNIPRTFVNVMTIFNISGVWFAGEQYAYCRVIWGGVTNGECPCLLKYGAAERQTMDEMSVSYAQVSAKVVAEFASENTHNPNFTAVIQPGISGYNITYFGAEFLSELDCFHPNLQANEFFTLSIWNNMMTAPPNKKNSVDVNDLKFICPTETSVIQ